jgi:hypothetical protein
MTEQTDEPSWDAFKAYAPHERCVICGRPVSGIGNAYRAWPHKVEFAHWHCLEDDD